MAILLQHRYSLPSLKAAVLKGTDALLHESLTASGKWDCLLQGLVLKAETDYDGSWDELQITPVSMVDFHPEASEVTLYDGTTHLIPYGERAPPQVLAQSNYVEYTGNEAEPGHLAYWASCMILSPVSSEI